MNTNKLITTKCPGCGYKFNNAITPENLAALGAPDPIDGTYPFMCEKCIAEENAQDEARQQWLDEHVPF